VGVLHELNTVVTACLGRLLGSQEVEAFRISRQSAYEGGKVVSPKHRPLYPLGDEVTLLKIFLDEFSVLI
jgi:hypothetical protein